ncbi:Holliday junction branch migration protein RuvA [Gulosibacter macacae]|uniref:Holliday junction branch migration complex subunit RuvA n=1 Tax=Gulosibacter macacae TaxID=2488791 RepID=A0A3P3W0U3_9MICO|nr:Holliday junction branch migration protein RuvA [Gulosibacter macacae]RRJ87309.1 Holliday junction branch migration protein RuvA [Gulosibacter macacae]
MIASLTGLVAHLGASSVVLDVSGVGYHVQITPAHALELRHGAEVRLTTALVVREDAMLLYGFRDQSEREVFDQLTGISGVGPKSALGVLSQLGPDELALAVEQEDEKAFKQVPGVGPKTAKLIILQLMGKLRAPGAASGEVGTRAIVSASTSDDVVEALVGLGTPQKQAVMAVETALERLDNEVPDVPTLLRAALRELGGAR